MSTKKKKAGSAASAGQTGKKQTSASRKKKKGNSGEPVASSNPLTPEQQAAENARSKKTVRAIATTMTIIILVLIFISLKYIVESYYYAFVLRSETIETAMENIDALLYTTSEKEELYELQAGWDSYRNSRLRDTVTTEADDGVTLSGYYFDNGSDVTVIGLHKYDSSGDDDFLYAEYFSDCNLLLPDARLHGSSGGDACSFGYLEAYDLACWLEWIDETLGDQTVILIGEGMGAATALIADELGLLADYDIAFLVADSPYSSLSAIARYTFWECYYIPSPLTRVVEIYADHQDDGFLVEDVDALTGAAEGSIPVLFLIGTENEYVPAEQTQALAEAWGGETVTYTCDSRNGLIYAEHTDDIQAEIAALIDTYVN